MTHTESFERFCAQPIGRAKLYLIDYAQTKADAATRSLLAQYLRTGSTLSLRTFAAAVESTQPNTADFEYLVKVKYNLWQNLSTFTPPTYNG